MKMIVAAALVAACSLPALAAGAWKSDDGDIANAVGQGQQFVIDGTNAQRNMSRAEDDKRRGPERPPQREPERPPQHEGRRPHQHPNIGRGRIYWNWHPGFAREAYLGYAEDLAECAEIGGEQNWPYVSYWYGDCWGHF